MAVPMQRPQHIPLSSEEREKLKEKVINQVRAVLLPEKHGMLLDNLNSKYSNHYLTENNWGFFQLAPSE